MRTASFTEFRNNARSFFDRVEKGETIEIYRHGRPAALLTPVGRGTASEFRETKALKIAGVSLSRALLADREKNDR